MADMTLTEQEREMLAGLFGYVPEPEPLEHMLAAVEAILAARYAALEALADEWERMTDDGLLHYANRYVTDLRRTLAAPTGREETP